MSVTYTYWRYCQKYTEPRSGTVQDVLQEAINDIEHLTASPESISVDGQVVYNQEAIYEADYDGGVVVDSSAIVIDEQRLLEH